jgi:putative SOS response-associated peptidase YedK
MEGETTNDLFGFLTTEPNAEVSAIHLKAMPVILTNPDERADGTGRRGVEAAAPAS